MFDRDDARWQSRLELSAPPPRYFASVLLAAVCGVLLIGGVVFLAPAWSPNGKAAEAWQASDPQDAPLNLAGQTAQAAGPTEVASGVAVFKNASGRIVTADQQASGMTAVASVQSPLRVGSTVQVTPSDGDIPAGGAPVVLTITGKAPLPAGICLDMSSQAWQTFDPRDAAYRHATITVADAR
jgi:hypothetical protein